MSAPQVFRSKVDGWLVLILLAAAGVTLYAAIDIAAQHGWLAALTVIFFGAGFPIWLLLDTRYVVAEDTLLIRCGPFRSELELSSIESITDTRNPASSPALSLDRLKISYGGGKWVLISPRDKEAFRSLLGYD